MSFKSMMKIILRVYKTEGVRGVLTRIRTRIKMRNTVVNGVKVISPITIFNKRDIIGFYDFVTLPDAGLLTGKIPVNAKNVINWMIPDFGIGSGGHLNIFRFINMLEKSGYTNNICLVGSHRHSSPEKAKELINEHFFPLKANVYFDRDLLPASEFSFATGWTTAYYLRNFGKTFHKFYFVQDYEPGFYAFGSEYAFAEETYRFGFTGVCAGSWLSEKLSTEYGMITRHIGFSYDRELYFPHEKEISTKKKVFCYFRPPTIRRGLETALLTLDIVGRNYPEIEFVFAGWDMDDFKFNHPFENAGLLPLDQLPAVYSRCDLALVLSFSNLSLLPLEIMACGCVVVSNNGSNVEWLLNNDNSQISSADPVKLAHAIVSLLKDDKRRDTLRQQGINFANSTNWENEGLKLVSILAEASD